MSTQFKPHLDTDDMYSAIAWHYQNHIEKGNIKDAERLLTILQAMDKELAKQGEP